VELEYRVIIHDGDETHERQHRQQLPITAGNVLELSGAERVVVRQVEQEPTLERPGIVHAEPFTSGGMGI
jgi:hypothetical protein